MYLQLRIAMYKGSDHSHSLRKKEVLFRQLCETDSRRFFSNVNRFKCRGQYILIICTFFLCP